VNVRDEVQAWTDERVDAERFRHPTTEFGILPFWFWNGELDPDELRFQLGELAAKRMHGVVLHGRYGLEIPYLSDGYLDRVRVATEEANALGLRTWIYDEMNWPSGTADKRVLRARPDLAQRYIECIGFTIQGPWFMCLTGEDSRYLDFERSNPVAAFAIAEDGRVLDLTPNLSFEKVVPWEVPPGQWRLCYVVEKRADYYIDAMDPESTKVFIELGYAPYLKAVEGVHRNGSGPLIGFYSDEPAMYYFLSGGDNPAIPWTKDMFRRFRERNGYDLRPRLVDLFFDVRPDSGRVRHDYYNTTTAFYADAYYRQLREWCREHGVVFTAHLLYEEWLRRMIRVEGNLFRHYENMDVVAVDHLYPVIGTRSSPDQHVALKVASSAAHQFGSPQVMCESFGGIFMDATMQRMKWIADWEHVLGVTILNPHGFHYTLEGNRKRDWPPSMFYQYPWWRHYGVFADYESRVSQMLSGGRHVARIAMMWPINAMFATYTPQQRNETGDRIEGDFNALTDLLLREHIDFDYLDEDVLVRSEIAEGTKAAIVVGDERYEAVLIPPISHLRLATLERLERFAAAGGGVLAVGMLPTTAFDGQDVIDVSERVRALLSSGAKTAHVDVASVAGEATAEMRAMAQALVRPPSEDVARTIREGLDRVVERDIVIDDDELFSLHRRKGDRDVFFVINPTFEARTANVRLPGDVGPLLWDPTTGQDREATPSRVEDGWTTFTLELPAVGSAFIVPARPSGARIVACGLEIQRIEDGMIHGLARSSPAWATVQRDGRATQLEQSVDAPPGDVVVDGHWSFEAPDGNGIVIERWLTREDDGAPTTAFTGVGVDETPWLPVVGGAWAYQQPAEPVRAYPIPVWFRAAFDVVDVPGRLHLLVDGFAGEDVAVSLNGNEVTSKPERSPFDSQMKVIDLTEWVRDGRNVLAIGMDVTSPTGGLLDRIKMIGSFSLDGDGRIVAPVERIAAGSWTTQGYPFLSGRGVYRTRFALGDDYDGCVVRLEVPMIDDVVEALVNGLPAGVRVWDPYVFDVTELVREGDNELELRVANTPSNLLNADRRPSGIAGPPRIVAARRVELEVPS
jgi:alpha-L-rhamnosidase